MKVKGSGNWEVLEKLRLKIGDSFSFDLKDGRKVSVVVADIRDGETYFVFEGIYWFRPMNYDYMKEADWGTSDMARWLNTEVLSQLPDDLVERIQPRKIGDWTGKLWLLSYEEVFGDKRFPIFEGKDSRIRKDADGDPRYWWTRNATTANNFYRVGSSGNGSNYNAIYSIGVYPGFIIG